jgi:mono/diheme cytochrome c family protein
VVLGFTIVSMKCFGLKYLIIGAALALAASAQTEKVVKTVPVKLSGTNDGAQLFREHCAVCHGTDGKGNGPAASALKRPVGDLTKIPQEKGKFAFLATQEKIRNGSIVEHGTVDMPIWGKLLTPLGGKQAEGEMRVYALTQYIEKIQAR